MKKYLNVKGSDTKKIKVEVDYDKGGMNYFNGRVDKRGYYLYVRVVDCVDNGQYMSESCNLFGSGYKFFLHEVGRKSNKQFEVACAKAEAKENELIQTVCREHGLEIE